MLKERNHTIRQEIINLLSEGPSTVRDISQSVSIMEKEVFEHLISVEKSLKRQNKKLRIEPYRCLNCGFVFKKRKKFKKPGKCPECRNGRIESALFWVE